jgi:nucleoside-diphosphate-sugar epimerase
MNTLVTGATGFVGHHLVAALCARGDSVRAFALPTENTTRLQEMGAAIYCGDTRNPEDLTEAMQGIAVVYHLAAIHGLWRPKQEYYEVNVKGTDHACQAALSAGVSQFVHVSSWTVYGMGLGKLVDENFPLRPFPDTYTETKVQAEKIVYEHIHKDQLPAVIIRPGTMFGPGDRVNFGRMAEKLRDGKAIIFGSGRNPMPFVYVKDVVEGMILAGTQTQAVGQAYNLSTDQPMTQEQLWRAIAHEIGSQPPRIHVPYFALYFLASLAERAIKPDQPQRQPLLTRLGVKLFGSDNQHSIEKACTELGYLPKTPVAEGVKITGQWFRAGSAV